MTEARPTRTLLEPPRAHADRIRGKMLALAARVVRWVMLPMVFLLDGIEIVRGDADIMVWLLLLMTFAFAVLIGSPSSPPTRRRAAVLVLGFMAYSVLNIASFGPLIGVAPALSAAVICAAIYFHRAGVVACIVAIPLGGVALYFSMNAGWLPFPDVSLGDVSRASNWWRMGPGFVVGLGAVGVVLAFVFARFERTIEQTVEAMKSLELERDARTQAQGALAQSQRMEAVGRLAGGVAHDFNNALVVILGAAEMLRKGLPEGSSEAALSEDLVGAARNATEITRQLLTLGRRDVTRARSVDVDEALQQVGRAVTRLVPDGVEVSVNSTTEARIWFDLAQLDQVLINLCINARDAMPEGGRISISATADSQEERVCIEVRDEGVGMDEATRTRIFEPFFTTKAEGKGTGLGLATAFGIIDASGGSIDCESVPGQGTVFRISLPSTGVVSVSPVAKDAPTLGRVAKILLVEDRDDVRLLMGEALGEVGHQITEAHDEESALLTMRQGQQSRFDILITDAVMPNTDTMAIIRRFQEVAPKAPVLVCSGHVEADLLRRGIETGRYRYLPKPFTPNELVTVVNDVLATGR